MYFFQFCIKILPFFAVADFVELDVPVGSVGGHGFNHNLLTNKRGANKQLTRTLAQMQYKLTQFVLTRTEVEQQLSRVPVNAAFITDNARVLPSSTGKTMLSIQNILNL